MHLPAAWLYGRPPPAGEEHACYHRPPGQVGSGRARSKIASTGRFGRRGAQLHQQAAWLTGRPPPAGEEHTCYNRLPGQVGIGTGEEQHCITRPLRQASSTTASTGRLAMCPSTSGRRGARMLQQAARTGGERKGEEQTASPGRFGRRGAQLHLQAASNQYIHPRPARSTPATTGRQDRWGEEGR